MRFRPVLHVAAMLAGLVLPAFGQQPTLPQADLRQATARVQAAVQAGQSASATTHAAVAARQSMLLEVLRNDPAQARAYALPAATRQALLAADPTVAPLLEYELTRTGELTESVADNWTDHTSTKRYTLHTATAELDLALPADVLATAPANHQVVTVHGLALAGVVAADRLTPATPDDAAACATPLRSNSDLHPDADLHPNAVPLACSPLGDQRVAVLIVKFPAATPAFPAGMDQAGYWNQVLFGAYPSVNTFWNEVSQGQTSASGDVYGPFTLNAMYDCTTTSAMQTAAITAAQGTVDFSQYNRVVIVFPTTNACTYGGLGNIGCVSATAAIAHQYSVVWLPIYSNYKPNFTSPQMWGGTSHELGHNLGLNHANTLDFNAISLGPLDFSTTNPGTVVGYGGGTGSGSNLAAVNTEYGDTFDVMGYPWTSGGPYNAVHRTRTLGWIPPADERDVTANGTFTLVPAENAAGLRALHVLRDAASASWLWVEYHQATSPYQSANLNAHLAKGDQETTGAQIHYETPLSSIAYTYLLDMTPVASTTAGNNNFYDGNLAPGTSWSDPYSLLTLTANSQTGASLGVTVSYDTPCATVALNASTIPAAGGAGTLTITAPSGCSWNVSSNALWISFTGATGGSGSAAIPFTASANTTTAQRNTYLTAQRQSVALVQPGTQLTLVGIAPNQGSSLAGAAAPFTVTLADAAGLSDFSQLNLNYSGFATQDCQIAVVYNNGNPYLYLYQYNSRTYTSGVVMGSGTTLSSPSCTLSAAASSYKVSGTSVSLTLGLTFPAAFLGEHNITGYAYGQATQTAGLPLGVWTVSAQAPALTGTATQLRLNPNTYAQGATALLAASVTPAGVTGSLTFFDQTSGSVSLGTVPLDANGNASLAPGSLALGAHSIVAIYNGDANFSGSQSAAGTLTITPNATTATTLDGASTVVYGLPYSVSSSVTPAAASGAVAFFNQANNTALASATLSGGYAAATIHFPGAGPYTLQARYPGDNVYSASNSPPLSLTVTQANSTTRLTASPQPVAYGSPLTLTALVVSPAGTGTVTFLEGGTTLGQANVVNGSLGNATLTLSTLSAGIHSIGAVYSGDANVIGSSSSPLSVTVNPASTSVRLVVSATTVTVGTNLTVTATVLPATASGVVSFYDGVPNSSAQTLLGTGTLSGGVATFSTSTLALGGHSLSAAYAGDANTIGAGSGYVLVTVSTLPSTTTVLVSSATTLVPSAGITLTAHVNPGAGTTSPGGNVTFSDGGKVLGTVALNAATAVYTASGFNAGVHQLTAAYAGSSGAFTGSTSNAVPVIVAQLPTSFAVNASAQTVFAGGAVTLTAAPGTYGAGTAGAGTSANVQTAGTMTFTDGTTTLGTVALGTVALANGGTASFTATNLAVGTHSFGAVYSGSVDLTGATGSTFAVAVQDFALSLPTGSATLNPGTGESFPMTIVPGATGFTSAVALTCNGAPAQATCTIAPAAITPGSSPATATLTLTTTARPTPTAGWLLLGLAPGLLALRRRQRARLAAMLAVGAAFAVLMLASGCGQGNFGLGAGGTRAGTYSLTISGTATGATTLTHATVVSLKVN